MGLGDLRSKEHTRDQQNKKVTGGKSNKEKDGTKKQGEIFLYSIQLDVQRPRPVITEWTPFLYLAMRKMSYAAYLTHILLDFGLQIRSLALSGHVQEAMDGCVSLILMFSLSSPAPFHCLSKNKKWKKISSD